MKNKIFKLEATAEINEICLNLYDATLNITVSDGKELKVILPDCKNVNIAAGEKRLIINQAKRLLNFGKQIITIGVPTHVVPDLSITGKSASISLDGGIFGELSLNGVCGGLNLTGCSFASVRAASSQLNVHISETTVKQNALLQIEKGQLVAENSFAQVADCRLKEGNMGLINLSGSNFTFETESGNITLTLAGCEEEYNTLVRVKNGTSNTPGTQNDGAQRSVKAFTESGNVLIDFVGERVEICEAAVCSDDTQNENDAQCDEERTL
ncbi:MAG: DUF4097 family beta strand repeat-containing protein [Candidatus Coproplasma sp.]